MGGLGGSCRILLKTPARGAHPRVKTDGDRSSGAGQTPARSDSDVAGPCPMRVSSRFGVIASLVVLVGGMPAQQAMAAEGDDDAVEMVVGSPPMTSDDTGTPGAGGIELNVIVSGEWSSD